MKNTSKTSQLSDILQIGHKLQEAQTESESTTNPSIIEPSTPEPSTKKAGWADNPKMRMFLAAGVVAIPTFIFVFIYGMAFELKTAVEKGSEAPEEITAETVDAKLPASDSDGIDENLRGIIAIGEQYDAISKIEKLEPKPEPEIKIEAKTIDPLPNTNPKPITQPQQPIVRRNAIRTVASKPKPTQIKSVPKAPQYDSMNDWYQLASSGSYGSKTTNQNERNVRSLDLQLNSPKAQLISDITATSSSTSRPQKNNSLSLEEENFLKLLDYTEPQKTVEVKKHQVAIAQQVEARLVTGINWVGNSQRVFIRLSEPLLDSQGNTQIPEDSMLVYEINNVNGGIVQGEVVSLIDAGEEIPLPNGAISVLDKKGKMLAAKLKEFKHNGGADALSFALGAARGTRDLISQPDSSFASISQFGQSQGTNYGNKNYPGAVLSGGATEVLENRLDEAQRRRNTSPITSFWQIEADTKIKLQTNYTFKY